MTRVTALVVAALVALATVPAGAAGVATAPAHGSETVQTTGFQLQQDNSTDSPPTADVSMPSTVVVGERVVLDGSGSSDDGSIASYRWKLDHGGAWHGEKQPVRFARPGQQIVTLTVTDDAGQTDTEKVTVDVTEPNDGNGLDASLSLSKQQVAVGEIFVMDASGTNHDDAVVGYWYDHDSDMEHERKNAGETVATCIDEPGNYTLHVWAVEEGSVDRASATIQVVAGDGGGGCNAGGSGSSGDGGSPSYDFDPTVVDVERNGNAVSVDADEVGAGENVTVDLAAPSNASALDFGELVVSLDEKESFTLDAHTSATAPNGTTPPAVNTSGFEPVGYLTVETADLDADALGGSTVSFALDGERLVDASATPADVTLYRWENGTWTAVNATVADWNATRNVSANATYAFTADLEEFSTFAVGVDQPYISVTNVTVAERGLHVGDTAEFTAVVRNDGRADGSTTVSFRIGDTVRNRTVDLAANATKRLTFVKRVAEPGERTVTVGSQSVYLWIEPQQTTTTTSTSTTTTSTGSTSAATTSPTTSGGQPGFGVAVALAALVAAALLARRRS